MGARGRLHSGFTLLELLVAVAVVGILATLAVPSFAEMTNRNRLTAAANELVASLQLAKMEAVRRNGHVVMCPSTNGTSCSGSNWSRSIVFYDADSDLTADGGVEEVVRDTVLPAALQFSASPALATNQRLWFGADGLVRVGSATPPSRQGSLSVCSSTLRDSVNARDVSVSVARISVGRRAATTGCTAPSN